MREDLQGLMISKDEVIKITGIDLNIGKIISKKFELEKFAHWFILSFTQWFAIGFFLVIFIPVLFSIEHLITNSNLRIMTFLLFLLSLYQGLATGMSKQVEVKQSKSLNELNDIDINKVKKLSKKFNIGIFPLDQNKSVNELESCYKLITEVKKYNSIIEAINVNDQLIETGAVKEKPANEREQLLEALRLRREDLIRGLKVDKILRENKSLIESNSEYFQSNLTSLETLQVQEKANEASAVINQAVSISMDIQEEMTKLMGKTSN